MLGRYHSGTIGMALGLLASLLLLPSCKSPPEQPPNAPSIQYGEAVNGLSVGVQTVDPSNLVLHFKYVGKPKPLLVPAKVQTQGVIRLQVTGPAGSAVPYTGPPEQSGASVTDAVMLGTTPVFSRRVPIGEWFDLSAPGDYSVSATYEFLSRDTAMGWTGKVKSRSATITVLQP